MKSLILGLILCSGLAHAETLNVTVRNFNFTYSDPHGEGSATSFSRTQIIEEAVNVSVDKVDSNFKLSVSGSENLEFEFKDAPSFMTDAETMSVNGFNLSLTESMNLSLASGVFHSKESTLKLDGLFINCSKDASLTEAMDQLISGCIQKMSFKSSKFSSQSVETTFALAVADSIKASLAGSDVQITAVNLKTTSGKYDLSAEVKAKVSGKVKSYGNISYDAATHRLTLKISEVKFSLFNITSKVFDELKKKESEKLVVKQPYVYFTIK
jgi:hypothetical protein